MFPSWEGEPPDSSLTSQRSQPQPALFRSESNVVDQDVSRGTRWMLHRTGLHGRVAGNKINIGKKVWRQTPLMQGGRCSGHMTWTRWWQHPSELMVSPGKWSIIRMVVLTKGMFLTQTCSSQPGGPPSSRTETPSRPRKQRFSVEL